MSEEPKRRVQTVFDQPVPRGVHLVNLQKDPQTILTVEMNTVGDYAMVNGYFALNREELTDFINNLTALRDRLKK